MCPEFSVYQFFADDSYEVVHRFIDAKQALITVKGLMESMGARAGTTKRIIITDGGDFTVWEWVFGEGIVFGGSRECDESKRVN